MLRRLSKQLAVISCGLSTVAASGSQATAQAATITYVAVTQEEVSACGDDVKRLCSDDFPDEAKVIACMRANRSSLSPACVPVFKAGLKRRGLQGSR